MRIRLAFLFLLVTALPSFAAGITETSSYYRGKLSVGISGVKTSDPEKGWLVDFQYVRYLSGSLIFWGLDGSYGAPIPIGGTSLISGGLVFGMEAMTRWGLLGGLSISVDAAQASQNGVVMTTSSLVALVKPQVYFGFGIGGGFRLALSAGYLIVSNVPSFGGPIAGIRIDYKTETTVKPVDD